MTKRLQIIGGFPQSDWNETDENKSTYINNKPTTMVGAAESSDGAEGFVPAPTAGDENKFLRGDGTWAETVGGNVPLTQEEYEGLKESGKLVATTRYFIYEDVSE